MSLTLSLSPWLAGGRFNPRQLFAPGNQGWIYDPSVFSSMFQDSAGTTPVTAVGQPVGKQLDLSGNGNHRIQPTSTSRLTLQRDSAGGYYLAYDGVDDSMYTAASVDFSGTDKLTMCMGLRKLQDASTAIVVESSANLSANDGTFHLLAPTGTATNMAITAKGTVAVSVVAASETSPVSRVLTWIDDISGDRLTLRLNGAQVGQSTSNQGTGNFGNYVVYFGRRNNASFPFNGREYANVCVGKPLSTTQITQLEQWTNQKMGVIY